MMAKLVVVTHRGSVTEMEITDDFKIPDPVDGWYRIIGSDSSELVVHSGNVEKIYKWTPSAQPESNR